MFASRSKGRTRRSAVSAIASLALAAGLIGLPALPAGAAVCKVNTTTDPSESQIQDIIDNTAPNGTVTFSGTCFGTFKLDANVRIVGTGPSPTIDGEASGSIFATEGAIVVTFTNLTLTNGSSGGGGGIDVGGAAIATVTKVRFVDNFAIAGGGIHASALATVTVNGSTFVGNNAGIGAGIYAMDARVTVNGSSFTGNGAANGAAIAADGCGGIGAGLPLTVTRSTFTRNATDYDGGAIWLDTVPTTISTSTFTGNEAPATSNGGAVYVWDDCDDNHPLSITGSTFTGNRAGWGGAVGAIAIGAVSVTSSRFISNVATLGGALGLNSTEGLTVTSSTLTSNQATDGPGGGIYGTGLYYGGGAVSIDRSTFTANRATGRGGAVSLEFGQWTTVDVTSSTFTRNVAGQNDYWGDGYWEMREGGGALFLEGYHLFTSGSTFTSNTALGSGGAIYYSGFFEGTFECPEVVLSRTVLKGNSTSLGNGGGLFAIGYAGSPEPYDCTTVQLEASSVIGNSAENGGGIYVDGYTHSVVNNIDWDQAGTLAIDSMSRVDGNRAVGDGGGLYTEDWHLLLQGSVSGNRAGEEGGGIYFSEYWLISPQFTITDAKVERNTAAIHGGGIRIDGDGGMDFIADDSEGPVSISYNKVTSLFGTGGGIYGGDVDDLAMVTPGYFGGDPTITIAYNQAKGYGGGLLLFDLNGDSYLDYGVLISKNAIGGLDADCSLDAWNADVSGNTGYDTDVC